MANLYLNLSLQNADFKRRLNECMREVGNLDTLLGVKRYLKLDAPTTEIAKLNQKLDETRKKVQSIKFMDSFGNLQKVQTIDDIRTAIRQRENPNNPLGLSKTVRTNQLTSLHNYLGAIVNVANAHRDLRAQTELSSESLGKQSGILKRLSSLASRYFSIQQIVQFGKKIAETTGWFQQQQVALEGILQSASKARKVLNDITNFALKSPFQTKELVNYTKQLSAFGITDESLFPTVTKLTDISAGLGVDMSRIILAYGQVRSASVLRGQELRQFTEAGIPMVDALAKKFSELNGEVVTTADVFDLISNRQVPFKMVAQVLTDMASEGGRFYKMQENIMNTMYGQMQKLRDMWTIAMNGIGKSTDGVIVWIIELLQKVVQNAKSIGYAMAAAFSASFIANTIKYALILTGVLKANVAELRKIAALRKTISSLKGSFITGGAGVAVGVIVGLITRAVTKANELKRKLEEIDVSFTKETNKMVDGVTSLLGKLKSAKKGSDEWNEALDTLKNNYGEFVNVNDELIQRLDSEITMTDSLRNEYVKLNNTIAAAIKLKQQYEQLKTEKETIESGIIRDVVEEIEPDLIKGTLLNAELFGTNQLKLGETLNTIFGTNYTFSKGSNSYNKLGERIMDVVEYSVKEFLGLGLTSKSDFANIYKKHLESEFVLGNFDDTYFDSIFSNKVYDEILGSKGYAKYREKSEKINGEENSSLGYLIKIQKAFEKSPEFNGSDLDKYYQKNVHYRGVLKSDTIQNIIKTLAEKEGDVAIKAFEDFNSIVNNSNSTVRDISKAFDKLYGSFESGERLSLVTEIGNLYKKNSVALTTDEEKLKDRLQSITRFQNNSVFVNGTEQSIQEYFEKWNPAVRGDETLKQTQEKIANEYSSLKKELEMYASKDSDLFSDEIKYIEKRMEVLKEIAKKEYYDVKLEDGNGGSNEVIPAELSNLFSDLKNAYSRYKEANQKGGIRMGLNYVRTDEQFQKMFGKFFGGANGESFAKIQGLKVGTKTVGELLSDKFMDGIEDGVLDFESAILAIAKDLEEYAGDDPNRKAYLQASKQLVQWVESTISKDNLNASLEELENELKSLTNSFERANKAVDLYRKLQENGTVNALGATIGITRQEALRTNSSRQMDYINDFVEAYNSKLPQDSQQFSIGNLSTTLDIFNAIEKIDSLTRLNGENFIATELGQSGETLKNMLKQLLDMRIQEQTTLSGEVYSGNTLQDLIANAKQRTESRLFDLTAHENIAREAGIYDMAAIKNLVNANQEEAKTIFDQFMKDNRLDIIARKNGGQIDNSILDKLEEDLRKKVEGLPDILRDELLSKMTDLRSEVNKYNASVGAFGSFGGAIRDYRNADEIAKEEYDKEDAIYKSIATQLETPELRAMLSVEEIDKLNVELEASEKRLEAMGKDGEFLADKLRDIALDNLKKSVSACQEEFQSMVSVVNSVVGAAKALSTTINKVYDVMNDGENPDWMKDMDGFLNDFGEAFEAIAAPMIAVISLVATLTTAIITCEAAATPLLIALGVIIAVAAVVAGVVAAFQAHDRKLEREIEDLDKHIEETQNSIKNLNAAAERMVGLAKQEKQLEALSKNLEMYHDALEKVRKEEQQRNTDPELVAKYTQESQEYLDEFLNGIHDWREEILFSVTDMASSIADAMRSAFQSGSNAAREMAAVVKQSIGDMVMNMIQLTVIEPAIQSIMEDFFGGTEESLKERFTYEENGTKKYDYKKAIKYFSDLVMNGDKMEELERDFGAVTTGLIDFMGNIDDKLSDYINFNSDTSSLSGGISGITEDTARQLEGIGNSMLMQQIIGNQHLEDINRHLFATVQVSWFNEMLQNSRSIKNATEDLNSAISDMRDSNGRALRVTMS